MEETNKNIRLLYNRKQSILMMVVLLAVLTVPSSLVHSLASPSPSSLPFSLDPASYVNPFIGTGVAPTHQERDPGSISGNVFPGASLPHGMVQWSPDTTNAAGGYRYFQSSIRGFSLTHFSGRGCSSYQDIPFMPFNGPITISPVHTSAYASTFSHNNEEASPGYYRVYLNSSGIDVALTVTLRTGFGQFTYPPSSQSVMLINAGGSAKGNSDAGTGVQIVSNNQVTGEASSGRFCGKANTYTVYFAATFDHPFTALGTWNEENVIPNSRTSEGGHSGAYLTFDTTQNPLVQVKVGLSFVSVADAQANLQAENPSWDFQSIRQQARAAWNARLRLIEVTGGTTAEQQTFYTALYHSFLHPNVFSDVNGQYLGFDQQVHLAQGYTQYDNFPGWDMYRSQISLLALLEPHEVSDMIQSLLADAQQGGGGLPRWEVVNDNSAGMVGDSQDVVIAMSYAFGARNFDTQAAWQAMEAGASQLGTRSGRYKVREGLSDYLKLGYVSAEKRPYGSAAITLEYAIDDFAIAQYASALGKMDAAAMYLQRSHNWQHLFNPLTGYIQPRNPDDAFSANFDPASDRGFVEGNSAQYSWLVPQDLDGLFAAMGGKAVAIKRLDEFFTQLNAGSAKLYAYMGNEPSFEVPWEYDAAGAAYRTQEVVRRIETQLFTNGAGGLPGNDDGGALSSWYVFAALGIYPEIPGVGGFFLGSPLFPTIIIHLGNGQQLQLTGQGRGGLLDSMPYVQNLTLNGQSYQHAWLPFAALLNGATLQFTLGSTPDTTWGVQ